MFLYAEGAASNSFNVETLPLQYRLDVVVTHAHSPEGIQCKGRTRISLKRININFIQYKKTSTQHRIQSAEFCLKWFSVYDRVEVCILLILLMKSDFERTRSKNLHHKLRIIRNIPMLLQVLATSTRFYSETKILFYTLTIH